MGNEKKSTKKCGIADAIAVLGDKWTLLIARDILMGNTNFEGIQNNLKISRNLLTERLKTMVANKILEKHVPKDKKRAKYLPTDRCSDLVKIFLSLSLWSEKWIPDTKRPKISAVVDSQDIPLDLKIISLDKNLELEKKIRFSLSMNK
mgnify:FL=1